MSLKCSVTVIGQEVDVIHVWLFAEHRHQFLMLEILANRDLVSEGIQIKQSIHFLVKDSGLECNPKVRVKLYLDSTSA